MSEHGEATSGKPVRKKKAARAPHRGKRDTRQHEHLITENGKQLGSALGVNMDEAVHTEGHDQGMKHEPETTMTTETSPAVVEIGEVDQELEANQMQY